MSANTLYLVEGLSTVIITALDRNENRLMRVFIRHESVFPNSITAKGTHKQSIYLLIKTRKTISK